MERGPGQVMSGDGFDGDFPEEFGEGWAGERMSRIVGRRLSKEEARFAAECLLAAPVPERARKTAELYGDDPEILYTVFEILRERWETAPARVREDAEYFYRFLERVPRREKGQWKTGLLVLDERVYFLGEAALIAGTTCRDLSLREEAWQWFRRAENWFLSTRGAEINLSRLSYQRLALLTEERRFGEVLELLPALIESFEEKELDEDALKCRFLEGNILKEMGHLRKAVAVFREIVEGARALKKSENLVATAQYNLVQLHAELDEPEQALAASGEAIPLLRRSGNRIGIAKLQWGLGMLYRRRGNSAAAIEAFRSAQMEFEDIQMRADVAALHLIIADLLLDAGQDREARSEIQAALPAIDELKLVPEGIAALSLLRQSLQGQRINHQALRDVHGYFDSQR